MPQITLLGRMTVPVADQDGTGRLLFMARDHEGNTLMMVEAQDARG